MLRLRTPGRTKKTCNQKSSYLLPELFGLSMSKPCLSLCITACKRRAALRQAQGERFGWDACHSNSFFRPAKVDRIGSLL